MLENLIYHLTQQEQRVDDLRRRLHFHSEKIRFVLDRLSIRLLTDIDAQLGDIRAVVDENLQLSQTILEEVRYFRTGLFGYISGSARLEPSSNIDSHVASHLLAAEFRRNLTTNAPSSIASGIPIAEGFDQLLHFFDQSTEGSDHTPEKYLLFLKSRWFCDRLKESREYELARPGLYYKRAINQISQAIAAKARHPGKLVQYDEVVLLGLPDSYFTIWPPPKTIKPTRSDQASLLMVRGNEQKVACIEFASDDQGELDSITVFRNTPSSFRVVDKASRESESGRIVNDIVQQKVNCIHDKLIPRYALPTLIEPSLEISIVSNDEEKHYQFDTMENLKKFQTAMTGYEIPYDCDSVQCQFSDSAQTLDCTGRLQIWQEPIILTGPMEESTQIQRQQSLVSSSSRSRYDSLAPTMMSTNTVQQTNGGWQADHVKTSAIVIYTQLGVQEHDKQFAIIFIELGHGISIDRSLCRCFVNYDQCSNIVLTTSKADGIAIRLLKPPRSSQSPTLDPNAFDVFPLRLPRHPRFRRMSIMRSESLVLKFKTLSHKRQFDEELRNTASVRDVQQNDQRHFEREIRYLADRPQRDQEFVSGNGHADFSSNESNGVFVPRRRTETGDTANGQWSALQSEESSSQVKAKKRRGFLGIVKKDKK